MGVQSVGVVPEAALASAKPGSLREAVAASMVSKSIEVQEQGALRLIASLGGSAPQAAGLGASHLGTRFDAKT